jgi:hypothetical protein
MSASIKVPAPGLRSWLDVAGIAHHSENAGVAFDDPWRNQLTLTTGTTQLPDTRDDTGVPV